MNVPSYQHTCKLMHLLWCDGHVPYAMLAHILRLPKKGVADLCLYKLQCNVYIGIKDFLAVYVAIDM